MLEFKGPQKNIEEKLADLVLANTDTKFDPIIRPSANEKFGDFQCNGVMAYAKSISKNPREVAQEIVDSINGTMPKLLSSPCEVAGPGFINFTISDSELFQQATTSQAPKVSRPTSIIVEYGNENIAKELHIGHLRGQNIGDSIARTLEKVGVNVIRDNHLGDWGTQFGMLIEYIIEKGYVTANQNEPDLKEFDITKLDEFYVAAKGRFDEDEDFATKARHRVTLLQGGDELSLNIWKKFWEVSVDTILKQYKEFDITLKREDFRGESLYNSMLGDICDELEKLGVAKDSDGALCVFTEGENDKDGNPFGLIIRKSNGGYGYATTDLATIKFRTENFDAVQFLSVADSRQAQHFKMVFDAATRAGLSREDIDLVHINHGTIQSKDGGPFKTRDGGTVKLKALLEEARQRAENLLVSKNPEIKEDPQKLLTLSKQLGYGSLKYGDLSSQRIKNYVFDWDKMISFDGNTAPYIQYAHARICSILSKVDGEFKQMEIENFEHSSERNLAKKLLQYPNVIKECLATYEPHKICTYLFSLSQSFTSFYENCNISKSEGLSRQLRLNLAIQTKDILEEGLYLLGIEAPERM
jgi:arginyl-tRNA synthetase